MQRLTISHIRGKELPDPSSLGFRWAVAQDLLEQHGRLEARLRETTQERIGLQRELAEKIHARGHGVGTDIPRRGEIEETQKRYEVLRELEKDLRWAADRTDVDLYRTVEEHREKWSREVLARRDEVLSERAEILRQLAAADWEVFACDLLLEWVQNPEQGVAFAPAPQDAA